MWKKRSLFYVCDITIIKSLNVVDDLFNIILVQYQAMLLDRFSQFTFIQFVNRNGCFTTKILSKFDYSIRLWYNDYAVAYSCKFFRKTSCCLNSEYLLFSTACLNFKDHGGRNSLEWNSLS